MNFWLYNRILYVFFWMILYLIEIDKNKSGICPVVFRITKQWFRASLLTLPSNVNCFFFLALQTHYGFVKSLINQTDIRLLRDKLRFTHFVNSVFLQFSYSSNSVKLLFIKYGQVCSLNIRYITIISHLLFYPFLLNVIKWHDIYVYVAKVYNSQASQ